MSDPFAAYGHRATSTAAARLVGVMKTRSGAKARYVEITAQLAGMPDSISLADFLTGIRHEIVQFETELPFFWEGDGDFAGLQQEIERATVRLDDGLDYPRHEPKQEKELDT